MGATKEQALTIYTRRIHIKMEHHHHNQRKDPHHKRINKFRRDISSIICYTCDEKGHYSKGCPKNKCYSNKESKKKRNHAHTIEDDEPTKKTIREGRVDSSSDDEYVL